MKLKLTPRIVIVLIVTALIFRERAVAVLSGKLFFIPQGQGPIINLEGFGAYVMGGLFMGLAGFVIFRLLGPDLRALLRRRR